MAAKQKKQEPHWLDWQTVRTESASARIVDQVWAALFRGELKPGDRICCWDGGKRREAAVQSVSASHWSERHLPWPLA